MSAPTYVTTVTETHELTHEQLVEAISEYVTQRSSLDSPDSLEVEIFQDHTREAEDRHTFCATVQVSTRETMGYDSDPGASS